MRRKIKNTGLFIVMIILGILISLQVKIIQSGQEYVTLSDVQELDFQVKSLEDSINNLENQLARYQEELAEYENLIKNNGSIFNKVNEDLLIMKKAAGATEMKGEGILVIVTDGQRELYEDENPNNLLVHDGDIQRIVDDLRLAGAEAISVNGQRVIFNKTEIKCTGPTIRVNDVVYSQPFIVKAIGNKNHLEAALNAPGKYGMRLKRWGVFVEVNTMVNVKINKYNY